MRRGSDSAPDDGDTSFPPSSRKSAFTRSAARAPRARVERSRAVAVATFGLAVVVAGLAVAGVFYVERAFRTERKASRAEGARAGIEAVRRRLDEIVHAVGSVRAHFEASEEVTREEFRSFTDALEQTHPDLRALGWASRGWCGGRDPAAGWSRRGISSPSPKRPG